jgi:hypothetical protein
VGDTEKAGIRIFVVSLQLVKEITAPPDLSSDFSEPHSCLYCLDLAEEKPALSLRITPVFEENAGRGSGSRPAFKAPTINGVTQFIYKASFFYSVLGPFNELELRLSGLPTLGRRDRHEIRGGTPPILDLVRDAIVVKLPVLSWRVERRIQYRILNNVRHPLPPCQFRLLKREIAD